MKILNILNGDATLYVFQEAKLTGDILVWREILSEGPVLHDISYQDFFALRSNWICKVFDTTPLDYKNKVIDEFTRLKDCFEYDEVMLWFEFDLHCQVNLIFLLNYFQSLNFKNTKLSLICPGSHPNHLDFRGIGQLSPQELALLPLEKVYLNEADLSIASKVWDAYSFAEKRLIEEVLILDFGNLDKLKPALEAHLKLFPNADTGLNSIEEQLVSIVNSGIKSRIEIYQELWKTTAIYGISDKQVDLYLAKLAPLLKD